MFDDGSWVFVIFMVGWVLALVANILVWVYRKPGITMAIITNGYPDESAPPFFSHKRVLSYVRDDKRKLVYGVGFVAVFLMMAVVLVIVIGSIFRY